MKLETTLRLPVLILTLAFSYNLFAQDYPTGGSWSFGAHIGTNTLDSEAAESAYIEDTAWSIGGSANYSRGRWLTSMGISILIYDDNASFSQWTEDYFGDEGYSDSSATGAQVFFAFGPKWHFGEYQDFVVITQAGAGAIFESSRSIPNCSNCYEEDIDIDSGVFLKAAFMQNTTSAGAFGIGFTEYLSGDQVRTIDFMWSMSY